MKRLALSLLLLLYGSTLKAAECPAPGSSVELFGTVGKDLGISMQLTFEKDRLNGTYFYVKHERLNVVKESDSGVYTIELEQAKKIPLNGSCAGGSLTLRESAPSGKPTGSFQGSFTTPQIVEGTWSTPDGKKTLPFHLQALLPADHVSGKYRTSDSLQEIDIRLHEGQVEVDGTAFWLNSNTGNVHTGDVEGTAKLEGNTAHYSDADTECSFTMKFSDRALAVSDTTSGCGGMNVTFNGNYERVGPPTATNQLINPY